MDPMLPTGMTGPSVGEVRTSIARQRTSKIAGTKILSVARKVMDRTSQGSNS